MIQRIIYAAAAVLAFQLCLAMAVHLRSSSHLEAASPNALFLSFSPDKINAVEIAGTEGKKVVLKKKDKAWIMPEAFSAPANGSQVDGLLRKLSEAKRGLTLAATKDAAKRFKTAAGNFERHIVLKDGESVAADFYLGTSADFRNSHARLAKHDEVVSIPVRISEAEASADSWLDTTLAQLDADSLKAIALADITLTKDKDWQLDGADAKAVKTEEVKNLADKAAGITVQSVLDPAKAAPLFNQPLAVQFTVTKKDGSKASYLFVKQDDHYVLKMSDNALYFKIDNWQLEGLAGMKRDKLLVGAEKKAEPPAAQAAPLPSAGVPAKPAQQPAVSVAPPVQQTPAAQSAVPPPAAQPSVPPKAVEQAAAPAAVQPQNDKAEVTATPTPIEQVPSTPPPSVGPQQQQPAAEPATPKDAGQSAAPPVQQTRPEPMKKETAQ